MAWTACCRELRQRPSCRSYRPAPARRVEIPKPDGGSAPVGHPHGAGPGRASGRQDRGRADLRGRLRCRVLVWVSAQAVGHRCAERSAPRSPRVRVGGGVRHPTLLRVHRPRRGDGVGGAAGVGSAGAQAGPSVAQAGCWSTGGSSRRSLGTPQGGVISPLLANIVLNELDRQWDTGTDGVLVRYADDFVVMCRTRRPGRAGPGQDPGHPGFGLGLRLHPDKTKVVDLGKAGKGSTFWAVTFMPACRDRLWEQRRVFAATTCTAGRRAVDETCPPEDREPDRS
jgi:RNA-directed DNA polymerase